MLVFTSGKIVCTGAKNEGAVTEAVVKLHTILDDYGLFFE
jgi:TATA-box binding protein (TBP) (component of TFIID and TFIIIB)